MEVLKQLFRDNEIEKLKEDNSNLVYLSSEDISKVIRVLANQKCNNRVLRKIIMTYPDILNRNVDDLEDLIYKLKEYNVLHFDKAFDNYPYLLNKQPYEIDSFFFVKQKEGLSDDEIIKILEEEPYKIEMTSN